MKSDRIEEIKSLRYEASQNYAVVNNRQYVRDVGDLLDELERLKDERDAAEERSESMDSEVDALRCRLDRLMEEKERLQEESDRLGDLARLRGED